MSSVRVALVADTHGHLDPRVAVVVRSCDLALHAGDIGDFAVLEQLQPMSGDVYAVRGNNDLPQRWPKAQQAVLAGIPFEASFELPGGELVLLHGHRQPARNRHRRLRLRYPRARVVCYGHSHLLADDRDAAPWILNPGAAGRARTFGGPSCMVLTATESCWNVETHRFSLPQRLRPVRQTRSAAPAKCRLTGAA